MFTQESLHDYDGIAGGQKKKAEAKKGTPLTDREAAAVRDVRTLGEEAQSAEEFLLNREA